MLEIAKFFMQRSYLALLIAGVLGGLAQLLLPLAVFSSAIVSLYLLRKGGQAGLWFALLTASVIYGLSVLIPGKPGLEFPVALMILPAAFICSWVLRASASQGLVVTAAGLFSAIMAIGIQIYSGDAVAFWQAWLQVAVQGVKGATVSGFEDNGTLQIMNGLMAMLFGTATLLSVLLARWMQSLVYNPGGFQSEFQQMRIPAKILLILLFAGIMFFVLQRNIMLDLLLIAAMMYCFQGLAIFHYTTRKKGYGSAYLLPPYLLLLLMPQFAVVGLACVGASDAFLNYRKLT